MKPKILLLQFRTDQSELHDQDCMRSVVDSSVVDLEIRSAVKEILSPSILETCDGLILSGSSEFYLGKGAGKDSWLDQTHAIIAVALEKNIPLFGLCFGHQLLLTHVGAKISSDEKYAESGSLDVTLTDRANADPIFSHLPKTFKGLFGHKDTPIDIPPNIEILASTERVLASAIRIKNKHAWSAMFHPELNLARMKERLMMFPQYVHDPSKIEEILATYEDAPVAHTLIPAFVQFVIDQKNKKTEQYVASLTHREE